MLHLTGRISLAVSCVVAAVLAAVMPAAAAVTTLGIDAPPPSDCNGSAGVLVTPQNNDPNGNPYLTKQLSSTSNGAGSTTYTYLITTTRTTNATYSELLDCAFSTVTGTPSVATYGTQQNNPTFTAQGQLTITLTVNANDSVCDRVQLKGTQSGAAFTDYSNLVGAPSGTTCPPPINTPEVPYTALLAVVGGAAFGTLWYVQRRRRPDDVA